MLDRSAFEVALGRAPADRLITGGRVVNVYTSEVLPAEIAICGDKFAAVGESLRHLAGTDTEIVDVDGAYIVPGMIDTHVHIEVGKLTVASYSDAVLPHGTTAVYTALDHMACVLGLEGVRILLDQAKEVPLRVLNPLPCRVPHTIPPSTIGGAVGLADQLAGFEWSEARGIAEVSMDFLRRGDEELFAAIEACAERRLLVHGDAPALRGSDVGAFMCAGCRDDHEMTGPEEMAEKLRAGFYCMIRECPSGSDLEQCIKVVTELGLPTRRISFCTDDVDARTLVQEGHIDHIVRKAIGYGLDPLIAIQMATLNAAEGLRLDQEIGAVGPGLYADFLLVEDLNEFVIAETWVGGRKVAAGGATLPADSRPAIVPALYETFRLPPVTPEQLAPKTELPDGSAAILAMASDEGTVRYRVDVELEVRSGAVLADPDKDVAYIGVRERYSGNGGGATAFMVGMGLREGALATSNCPDDQNVLVVAADLESMATAINRIAELRGGQVVARGTEILAELALPVAGMLSDISAQEMVDAEAALEAAARTLGELPERPFARFLFTQITTLPEWSLTDKGLVEYATLSYVDPVLGPVSATG
ncbi:MAG: adenine deaminase C-terminal domain-containing protein [Solirubrobacteraceae bacterium]